MIARLLIIMIAVPVLIYAFIATLIRETGNALQYARLAAGSEIPSIQRAWRAKSIRPEKW